MAIFDRSLIETIDVLIKKLYCFGGRKRTIFIRPPLPSTNGSRPKSCFKASTQGRCSRRGRFFCRRRVKIASEVWPTARGANRPKFRTEC